MRLPWIRVERGDLAFDTQAFAILAHIEPAPDGEEIAAKRIDRVFGVSV